MKNKVSEVFARNPKVEAAPLKDETVLFNPANNKFCLLNATAAFIWQALERPQTAREITAALVGQYANVALPQAEHDVQRALQELREIECVESASVPKGTAS